MSKQVFISFLKDESRGLFKLKKTDRLWHIPVLAMLATGVPLLIGYFLNNLSAGLLSCLAGLVILYLPTNLPTAQRMIMMLVCSFGFMISFSIGIIFSFNYIVSSVVFGFVAVYWLSLFFRMAPPGSFFFIMINAMMINIPFDAATIPTRIGYFALGTIFACTLALIYCFIVGDKYNKHTIPITFDKVPKKKKIDYLVRALIVGFFMFIANVVGNALHFNNPYWIPISCLAILQGITVYHVWQRALHRIAGTFIGMALCWILISISQDALYLCICIMILQFVIELFITRNYAIAVIFITALTVLLAEAGGTLIHTPNILMQSRLLDIIIGSLIGAVGGWFLHHQYLRTQTRDQIRKTIVYVKRKN